MGLWPFGTRIHKLSDELRRELLKTFEIEAEDTAAMRYAAKPGRLGNERINRVCIFSPTALSDPELASANYENLMILNKGMLFTGHMMKAPASSNAELVVLHDKRAWSL